MYKILIKDIIACCPIQKIQEKLDLLIEKGSIKEIKKNISDQNYDIKINGNSKYFLFPSLFDMNSYAFRDLKDNEENKSQIEAAIAGGFSGLNVSPYLHDPYSKNIKLDTLSNFTDFGKNSPIPISFPLGIDYLNHLNYQDYPHLFISDSYHSNLNSLDLLYLFQHAGFHKKKISFSSIEKRLSQKYFIPQGKASFILGIPGYDPLAESLSISKNILFAQSKDVEIHLRHISTLSSLKKIYQEKKRSKISANLAFHQLIFTEDDLIQSNYNSLFRFYIPLIASNFKKTLILALKNGIIDTISSEDSPSYFNEKRQVFIQASYGIISLEVFFSQLYENLIKTKYLSILELLEKISSNPRKILNNEPLILKKGFPATFSIFDESIKWIPKVSKFKNSPWIGKKITGAILFNIYNGKILFDRSNNTN